MLLTVFKSLVLSLKSYKREIQDTGLIEDNILVSPCVLKLLDLLMYFKQIQICSTCLFIHFRMHLYTNVKEKQNKLGNFYLCSTLGSSI